MALSLAQAHEHIETDLPDAALQRLIDAAEKEVGPDDDVQEYSSGLGRRFIFLRRPASAITSATEHRSTGDIALASNDYVLRGTRQLERLNTGTNPANRWEECVTIVYVPADLEERMQAVIDLVRLEVERRAVGSESEGDYRMTAADYEAEKEKILSNFVRSNFA